MGGPGSGRQKAPGPRDATVRIVTSLEMWEDTVFGFNQMENAAAAFTDKLDDGTPIVRNFADGNFEMAKEVKENAESTEDLTKRLATKIIILQGTASALNQATGGARKFVGSLRQLNIGTDEQHESMGKAIAAFEMLAGPMEVALSLTTILSTIEAYHATTKTAETTAITANTAAVNANTLAWYANPMYWAIAAIVAGVLLLAYSLNEIRKNWQQVTEDVKKFTDGLLKASSVISAFSFGGLFGTMAVAGKSVSAIANMELIS